MSNSDFFCLVLAKEILNNMHLIRNKISKVNDRADDNISYYSKSNEKRILINYKNKRK